MGEGPSCLCQDIHQSRPAVGEVQYIEVLRSTGTVPLIFRVENGDIFRSSENLPTLKYILGRTESLAIQYINDISVVLYS